MNATTQLRRVTSFAYGDALASEVRVEGVVPVFSSGGESGRHDRANTHAPCIIVGRKGSHGSVWWSDRPSFVIDTAYWIDQRNTAADLRWLYYVLRSMRLDELSNDVGVPGLSRDAAYSQRVPFDPSVTRQRQIADFLDDQVFRIDNIIAARRAQVKALREGKLSLLLEEMVGEYSTSTRWFVPWGSRQNDLIDLGRIAVKQSRPASAGSEVVTAFRDGYVGTRSSRRADGFTVSDLEQGYQGVDRGDLVFHGLDGFAGASGVAQQSGRCSPVYHVFICEWADHEYVSLALQVAAATGYLAVQVPSTRQRAVDMRNWATLASIEIPCPELDEQRRIAKVSQRRLREFSRHIEALSDSIALLIEYKQSLITAAVTGEFDVTSASGRSIPA